MPRPGDCISEREQAKEHRVERQLGQGEERKERQCPYCPGGFPLSQPQRAVAKSTSLPLTSHRRTNLQLDPTEASIRC